MIKLNLKFNKNLNSGFTLIEIMVSIAIFTIIMVMGIGALLNTNTIHKVSNNQRALIDNLGFMMEDMTRNIRLGTGYDCGNSVYDIDFANHTPCPTNADRKYSVGLTNIDNDSVIYLIHKDDNSINNLCHLNTNIDTYDDYKLFKYTGSTDCFANITPTEVRITEDSGFVVGGIGTGDGQPYVKIRLFGVTKYKNIETPFNIQTFIVQRATDS